MLASGQHVSLDVPAAFPIGDALPGRGGGELLAVTHTGDGTWFPAYDGNGSGTGYVDESGNPAAAYRYGPCGLPVSATGPEKDRFRHHFSTKPQDKETGLLYYGIRYLGTTTCRWVNRDPIEEGGGVNMYGFIGNDGVNAFDFLGLKGINVTIIRTYIENETIGSLPIVATDERAARCCGAVTGATQELPRGGCQLQPFGDIRASEINYPMPEVSRRARFRDAATSSASCCIRNLNIILPPGEPGWGIPCGRIANFNIDLSCNVDFRGTRMHAGWSCFNSMGCPIVGPGNPTLSKVVPSKRNPGNRPGQEGVEIDLHTFDRGESIAKQVEISAFVECVKGLINREPAIWVNISSQ